MKTTVISLGGSIVVPSSIDTDFLQTFKEAINAYLSSHTDERLIFVVGGGAAARNYQNAVKALNPNVSNDELDRVGIRATHINGEYVRLALGATSPLVVEPKKRKIPFEGKILVAGGWKPGFSTDTDAIYLALKFGANTVINLSNTDMVYTADPRKDKNAKPIEKTSWSEFLKLVGTTWEPGRNVPFDPIASKLAKKHSIQVVCANGRNIENTINILEERDFIGTVIE